MFDKVGIFWYYGGNIDNSGQESDQVWTISTKFFYMWHVFSFTQGVRFQLSSEEQCLSGLMLIATFKNLARISNLTYFFPSLILPKLLCKSVNPNTVTPVWKLQFANEVAPRYAYGTLQHYNKSSKILFEHRILQMGQKMPKVLCKPHYSNFHLETGVCKWGVPH